MNRKKNLFWTFFRSLQWKTGSSKAMLIAEGILQKLEEKYKTPEK